MQSLLLVLLAFWQVGLSASSKADPKATLVFLRDVIALESEWDIFAFEERQISRVRLRASELARIGSVTGSLAITHRATSR